MVVVSEEVLVVGLVVEEEEEEVGAGGDVVVVGGEEGEVREKLFHQRRILMQSWKHTDRCVCVRAHVCVCVCTYVCVLMYKVNVLPFLQGSDA